MKREDITPEYLQEVLDYNPKTGELFWKVRPVEHFKNQHACNSWNANYSGRNINKNITNTRGYYTLMLHGLKFKAHRVAYAIHHKKHPEFQIDHINGIKTDNRIENLRDVTNEENSKNRPLCARNTSG